MVLRRPALLVAGLLLVSACAPTRAAAPPDVELVRGSPPSTVVSRPSTTTTEREPAGTTAPRIDVAATLPPLTGWAAVDAYLRDELLTGNTAASVAVSVGGDIVHASAFGARFPAGLDRAEPIDRFRIASISKVVTAIVVLQLVQDGTLRLDEPILGRVGEYVGVVPTDPDAGTVTVEQLLSHTSGFPAYESLFFRNGAPTCPDAARQVLTRGIRTPGGFDYSNANYCTLGLVIEAVTGLPYEEVVYGRLLTPLGITGMRLAGTYDVGPDEVLHTSAPGRSYMEALGAAGAWIASPTDLVRIVDSLRPGGTGWRPLSDELAARMASPPFGRPLAYGGYGLGLILYPDGSFGHTGTLENTHAMVLSRPDGMTWAAVVSGDHPSESDRLRTVMDRALAAGFPDG